MLYFINLREGGSVGSTVVVVGGGGTVVGGGVVGGGVVGVTNQMIKANNKKCIYCNQGIINTYLNR